MQYLELKFIIPADFFEIIMAELSSTGFDSFMEDENVLHAYVDSVLYRKEVVDELLARYFPGRSISWTVEEMENKNWNEEWEKNFEPVIIKDQCAVKASFHKLEKQFPYEIIINPKMSFGTGHHETTSMMIEQQLEADHKNKKVVDAGSGTGVLAILAEKLGSSHVVAYDIEDWAFENLKENINLNGCRNIIAAQGVIDTIKFTYTTYDLILANINKNVLLKEIPAYSRLLKEGGLLIVSGFYLEDIPDIENVCKTSSLKRINQKDRNKWASLAFEKLHQVYE